MGPAEDPLRRLGSALAAAQDGEFRALGVPRAGERLLREVVRQDKARRTLTQGAALALALGLAIFFLVRPRPLSFAVGAAGSGRIGDWISAQAAPLPLAFSDGTLLTLAPEARARVIALDGSGARLVLEQGTLSAQVVHRRATRWTVVAGPFEVRVTGTRFEVLWSPDAEVFELRLNEGAVTVAGPFLGEGRSMRAGEALRIAVREQTRRDTASTTAVSPSSGAESVVPGPPAATSSSIPLPTALPDVPTKAPPSSTAQASPPGERTLKALRALAARGNYAEAVRLAEANDFSALCRQGTFDDLMLLADAARFSGAAERARDALLSLRERFSEDPRAATAAFLLGRIFFEQLGAHTRAAEWFSVYLDEQPDGELAGDALSRLAESRALSGDRAGAREAARRYLRSNPNGPQAERAKLLAD